MNMDESKTTEQARIDCLREAVFFHRVETKEGESFTNTKVKDSEVVRTAKKFAKFVLNE